MTGKQMARMNEAQMAHYNARIFVLNEQLEEADTEEEFIKILRDLDLIEHHLECTHNRKLLSIDRTSTIGGIKNRCITASKEIPFGTTVKATYSLKR